MKRYIYIYTFVVMSIGGLLCGCTKTYDSDWSLNDDSNNSSSYVNFGSSASLPKYAICSGVLYIKISSGIPLSKVSSEDWSLSMSSVPPSLSSKLKEVSATRIERVFPPGRFEERLKAMGMDTWYYLYYDESEQRNISKVFSSLQSLRQIEAVEYVEKIESPSGVYKFVSDSEVKALVSGGGNNLPFDDPLLAKQWHYHNDGSINSDAVAGADINLFKAWEKETGKSNVIVAVIDGGIDYEHEDLADNMWVNEKERDGIPGKDNDGNGYIGDIHGVNLVNFMGKTDEDFGKVVPDDNSHGTHVAGTVAARNNNGIGVSGVAGGDGTPESGVRLMSVQIFRKKGEQGDMPRAFQYACDMGAVIAQNSWGYKAGLDKMSTPLREAIDYFITYAGCDENGNQRPDSPMKGGVVLFAAGNDNMDDVCYPATYDKVISVSSFGWDWRRASYSNRGDWVTLCAPGGDQERWIIRTSGILSTVSPKVNVEPVFLEGGSKYAWYQGTSMATPHASGVAALICSKFGKQGFTANDLKQRMMSFRNKDINKVEGNEPGRLGKGYIDAAVALEENENITPDMPKVLPMTEENNPLMERFTNLTITWRPSADKDATHGFATSYMLYYSKKQLTESNYSTGKEIEVSGLVENADVILSQPLSNLEDNTTYYFALLAKDKWGNTSKVAFFERKTSHNHPPVASNVPAEVVNVLDVESIELMIGVKDEDGHKWDYIVTGDTKGVYVSRQGDQLKCTISAVLPEGEHAFNIVLTDELGKSTTVTIPFNVIAYKRPRLNTTLDGMICGLSQGAREFNLLGAFTYTPQVPITLSARSSDNSVATATIDEKGNLKIVPQKIGEVQINIEATDAFNKVRANFKVRVVQDADAAVYLIYPIPVKDKLNLVLNPELGSIRLKLTTLSGEKVLSKSVVPNAESRIATLDFSKIAAGTYLITAESSKGKYQKVINKY